MTIDYATAAKQWPKQKAALTRAIKTKDRLKVVATTADTIRQWDNVGSWPDDWHRWNRALTDVFGWSSRVDADDIGSYVRAGYTTDMIVDHYRNYV